jgi:hypothetical protein
VWTQLKGAVALSTNALVGSPGDGTLDVSGDGSFIAYLEGAGPATLMVATIDGQKKSMVLSNVDTSNCSPSIFFGGTNLVATYCLAPVVDGGAPEGGTPDAGTPGDAGVDAGSTDASTPGDAGSSDTGAGTDSGPPPTPPLTLAAFPSPNFTATTLGTFTPPANANNAPFIVNAAGTAVLAYTDAGLVAYRVAGGSPATVDATGNVAAFTSDGANVLYTTTDMALKRSPIASPAPVSLVGSNVAGFMMTEDGHPAVSPDGNWVLTYQNQGGSAGTFMTSDLYLSSTATPGAPTAISTATSGGLFGTPYTTDSKFTLYLLNIMGLQGGGGYVGDLYVAPVSGGSSTKVVGNVWEVSAAAGSKVTFSDNYTGMIDIRSFDANSPGMVTTLVSQADDGYVLNHAKDQVVYSWTCNTTGSAGIWAAPVP